MADSLPLEAKLQFITDQLPQRAKELGFQQLGIADIDLSLEQPRLQAWLDAGYHGEMQWMEEHKDKRIDPSLLHEGCLRAITVRMDYFPQNTESVKVLNQLEKAYISRYALGRDYHKLIRKRLAILAKQIAELAEPFTHAHQRAFVDSAPILERPLAEKAGLGWVGKHTLLLNDKAGSWFFLGEILTNLPLPTTPSHTKNRCGDCSACLKICPTDAFPKPYQLDARRCISYLTIENKGPIPEEFREPIGNRIFGCDDCQAVCPWNRWAQPTSEADFQPRHQLDSQNLVDLFLWDEQTFLKNTQGSAIRRIGYERWLRNIAVGLGNAPKSEAIVQALEQRKTSASELVQEHITWAIERQKSTRRRKRKLLNTR